MLARKWIDKDGNEHSFEEQEAEEGTVSSFGRN